MRLQDLEKLLTTVRAGILEHSSDDDEEHASERYEDGRLKAWQDLDQLDVDDLRTLHDGLVLIRLLSEVPVVAHSEFAKIEVRAIKTPERVGRYISWKTGTKGREAVDGVWFVGASLPDGTMIVERVSP